MQRTALIILLLFTCVSAQASRLNVEITEDSCYADMVWMQVDVTIDNELYRFNPACEFSFNKTMVTPDGISCTLSSQMCFHFNDYDELTVECDFGEKIVKKFPCDNWRQIN